MKKFMLCLCIVAGMASFMSAVAQDSRPKSQPKSGPEAAGKAAPSFELMDTAGKKHSSKSLKDKIVIVEWIEPACPTCRRHAKDGTLNAMVKKYEKNKNVVIIGICTSSSSDTAAVKAFKEKHKLNYTILMDPTGKVGKQFGAKKTPHMYIINKGKIAYDGALDNDPPGKKSEKKRTNYITAAVDSLLKGKTVKTKSTKPYG